MKRLILAAAFVLAACSQSSAPSGSAGGYDKMAALEEARAPAPEAAPAPPTTEVAVDASIASPGEPPKEPGTPPGAPMLAYAYSVGIETPAKAVSGVMKAHEQACVKAGANVCQVLGSGINSYGEDNIRAQLQLRAEPRWLAMFRDSLEGDAKEAGGKITSNTTTSEDLTRAIVDTEANLRAQRTLRDRLQGLLASRPGKLQELLEVERELARVQGEIDSMQSNLAVMKTRVAMSLLTIDYASADAPVTDTTFEPLADALVSFARVVSQSLAAIILFIAAALPWAALIVLILWLVLRWRRRARAGKASAAATDGAST